MASTVMARTGALTSELRCSQRRMGAASMPSLCSPCTRRHPAFRQSARFGGVVPVAQRAAIAEKAVASDSVAAAHLPAWLAPTLLAAGASPLLAAQALAEPLNGSVGAKQADAIAQTVSHVEKAKDTVADAVQKSGGPPAPAPAELLLVLSPILLYGIFTLYRSKVNPRAKLQDFAFIVTGLVIVANLVSILVFKIRFF